MSTWMVIVSVWVMFAACVVLFVRGASPHIDAQERERDERASRRADRSRMKA
jgi:hypothetical protein